MPHRLIYRCGRFLDEGYVTLSSSPTLQKSNDIAILQSFRDTGDAIGATGVLWTLVSEGRDVSETLIFIHEKKLTAGSENRIKDRLRVISEKKLPGILEDVSQRALLPSEARAIIEYQLKEFSSELEKLEVVEEKKASNKQLVKIGVDYWKAVIVGAVVLLGFVAFLFFPTAEPVVKNINSGPTVSDIREVANPCYPSLTERQLEDLERALENDTWSAAIEGKYDYLRPLSENERSLVEVVPQQPIDLCKARNDLWKKVDKIRTFNSKQSSPSFEEITNQFSIDRRAQIVLFEVMENLSKQISTNPFPDTPKDCALGRCMPLVTEAEITLKKNVDNIYDELRNIFQTEIDEVRYRLRVEEVKMRGEMSLLGVSPIQILERYKLFWSCFSDAACDLPMYGEPHWLSFK